MTGLEVEGVAVTYPGNPPVDAVRSASLRVKHGETIALVGPSGCGKSTLLAAIAGIVPLASGRVSWDGADLAEVPVHERGFGMVFQDGQLFPHRDVAANVAFGLEMAKMDKGRRDARVAELLALVGLSSHASRRIDELSGGERQRVALARTLAPEPALILLDEPLSSLDRALRDHLAEDLVAILHQTDATAILVTHDLQEATSIGTRVIRMADGVAPR